MICLLHLKYSLTLTDNPLFNLFYVAIYKIVRKTNDREIIYESHELMKADSVYFSLANSVKTQ